MPRFVFRLDPVLAHRERIETERQLDLAVALAKVRDEEARRDELTARRAALRAQLLAGHAEMEAEDLRAGYAHCEFLDREIASQETVVLQVRAAAEVERGRLVAATKDKKVLETLKQRRREAFESQAATTEQALLDDLNSRLFDRHPRESLP
jgi:flagellar FliJ protein